MPTRVWPSRMLSILMSTLATHYWQFVVLWGFVVGIGSGMAAAVLVRL